MQKIEGDNNYQAGRDNNISNSFEHGKYTRPPDLSHPNAMECPQCWLPTWIASVQCACGYDLVAHHHSVALEIRAETDKKVNVLVRKVALSISGVSILILVVTKWLEIQTMFGVLAQMGAVGGMVTGAVLLHSTTK